MFAWAARVRIKHLWNCIERFFFVVCVCVGRWHVRLWLVDNPTHSVRGNTQKKTHVRTYFNQQVRHFCSTNLLNKLSSSIINHCYKSFVSFVTLYQQISTCVASQCAIMLYYDIHMMLRCESVSAPFERRDDCWMLWRTHTNTLLLLLLRVVSWFLCGSNSVRRLQNNIPENHTLTHKRTHEL